MKKIMSIFMALFSMSSFGKEDIANKGLVLKQQAALKAAAQTALAHPDAAKVEDRKIREVPRDLLKMKSNK